MTTGVSVVVKPDGVCGELEDVIGSGIIELDCGDEEELASVRVLGVRVGNEKAVEVDVELGVDRITLNYQYPT